MTELTPLAVSHKDVLLHLATSTFRSVATIHTATDRVPSNIRRDLKKLAGEGLVDCADMDMVSLTDTGRAMVEALRRAQAPTPSAHPGESRDPSDANGVRAPEGYAQLIWMQIDPDPLNPRKHFDEESIEELADSIARDGLLENLVVRPGVFPADPFLVLDGQPAAMHRLVAGERRHRAIKRLIETGRWETDAPILCRVVDIDDAGHRRIALVENLQRKDLRPIDEANALKELMAVTGVGTAEVATEIGFTQRFVQQRLQLLDLPAVLQGQVNDGALPIEKARAAVALIPRLPPIKQVEVSEGKISVDQAKEWLDRQPTPIELTPLQWLMALELTDALRRRPMKKASYESDRTEVAYAAKDDGQFKQLVEKRLFNAPSDQQDKHYQKTGRLYVSATWDHGRALDAKFGEVWRPGGAALQQLLAKHRAAAGIDGEFAPGVYTTAWLNGPFDVPAEAAAAYAKVLAKRKADEAAEKATREKHQREAEARKTNAAANAEVVHDLVTALSQRPPNACDPRFAETLDKAGVPAPWRIEPRARVAAANGAEVMYPSWYLDEQPHILAQRVLLVAAVNLAAGATFTVEPDGTTGLTREAYITTIAARLLDDRSDEDPLFPDMAIATDAAGKALDRYLAKNELTFGDAQEDWELIVDEIVEAAFIEADPQTDPELNPALRALAGGDGARREIAEPEAAGAP